MARTAIIMTIWANLRLLISNQKYFVALWYKALIQLIDERCGVIVLVKHLFKFWQINRRFLWEKSLVIYFPNVIGLSFNYISIWICWILWNFLSMRVGNSVLPLACVKLNLVTYPNLEWVFATEYKPFRGLDIDKNNIIIVINCSLSKGKVTM